MILRGFHRLRDEDLLPKARKRRHDLSPAYPFNFHCSPHSVPCIPAILYFPRALERAVKLGQTTDIGLRSKAG